MEHEHGCCNAKSEDGPARPRASAAPAPAADHTCPMHPEVRQKGPGSCPKCGMALEPVVPSAPATRRRAKNAGRGWNSCA